jgi:hypothetical protein
LIESKDAAFDLSSQLEELDVVWSAQAMFKSETRRMAQSFIRSGLFSPLINTTMICLTEKSTIPDE